MSWLWQIGTSTDAFSTFGWYPTLGQANQRRSAPPILSVQPVEPVAAPPAPALSWQPSLAVVPAHLMRRASPPTLSVYPFPAATDAAPLRSWAPAGTPDNLPTLRRARPALGESRWVHPVPTDAAPLLSWQGSQPARVWPSTRAIPEGQTLYPFPTPVSVDAFGWRPTLPAWVGPSQRRRPASYTKLAAVITGEALPLRWLGQLPHRPWDRPRLVDTGSWWGPTDAPAPAVTFFGGLPEFPVARPRMALEGWAAYPFPAATDAAPALATVIAGQQVLRQARAAEGWFTYPWTISTLVAPTLVTVISDPPMPRARAVAEGWRAYPFPAVTDAAPTLAMVVLGQMIPPRPPVVEGWHVYPFPTPVAPFAPDAVYGDVSGILLQRSPFPTTLGTWVSAPSVMIPVPGLVSWNPTYPDRGMRLDLLRGAHPWHAVQNVDPLANPPAPDLSWGPTLPDRVWGRVLYPQLPQVWTSVTVQPPAPDDRVFLPTSQAPAQRKGLGTFPAQAQTITPPAVPELSWKGMGQDWLLRRAFPQLPFEVDASLLMHVLIAQQLAWRGEAPALHFRPIAWDHTGGLVEVILPSTVADGYPCVVLGVDAATFSQIVQVSCTSLLLLSLQSSTITDLAVCAT